MSTEDRSSFYSDNLNFVVPPLPSVERGNAPQLNAWADDRLAIYASLDAAMTQQIVQAISSLSELKQWVEEDARRTIRDLTSERETLQREIKELRLEQVRIQDDTKYAQHQLEEAHALKLAVEHEAQNMLHESRLEQERIQVEISHLTTQMDAMGQQMQAFLQQRFSQLWENFVESLVTQNPTNIRLSKMNWEPIKEQVFRDSAVATQIQAEKEGLKPAIFAPDPPSRPESPVKQVDPPVENRVKVPPEKRDWLDFDDLPTPPLADDTSVARPDKPAEPELRVYDKVRLEDLDIFPEIILPKVNPGKVPQERTSSGRLRRDRGQEAELRLQRLLSRRGTPPAEISAKAGSSQIAKSGGDPENLDLPFEDRPTVVPGRIQPDTRRYDKERERAELEEIGAKLGFEVVTPPSLSAVRFAPGFKPRGPRLPTRSPADKLPKRRSGDIVPTIDYVQGVSGDAPSNSVDLAASAKSPSTATPPLDLNIEEATPTTPAPRIGDLGDDMAHNFRMENLSSLPNMPLSSIQPGSIEHFASIHLPQPTGESSRNRDNEDDIETKLTISNLQGLSLLMMEKVVRGMDGVHHVTVTDFRKGVLEMDVRHSSDVKLDEVLTAMSELKLMLVERGPNSLEFLQEK